MIRNQELLEEVARRIKLVERQGNYGDFCSCMRRAHHTSAADTILGLLEKKKDGKTRSSRSVAGLTKRLKAVECMVNWD